MCILLANVYVYPCIPGAQEGQKEAPGTRITDVYEPLYGYQKFNLGPLEEQPVLSATELYFQPKPMNS